VGRKKQAGKTIENRTQPELVPNQASKLNIVRGALKTAKALGIDVPLHLQQLADEVIERSRLQTRSGGQTEEKGSEAAARPRYRIAMRRPAASGRGRRR
jgi:hypothetical protein